MVGETGAPGAVGKDDTMHPLVMITAAIRFNLWEWGRAVRRRSRRSR